MLSVAHHASVLQAPGQVLLGSGWMFTRVTFPLQTMYPWREEGNCGTLLLLFESLLLLLFVLFLLSHTFLTTSTQVKTTELTHHGLESPHWRPKRTVPLYNSAVTEMRDSERKLTHPSRFRPISSPANSGEENHQLYPGLDCGRRIKARDSLPLFRIQSMPVWEKPPKFSSLKTDGHEDPQLFLLRHWLTERWGLSVHHQLPGSLLHWLHIGYNVAKENSVLRLQSSTLQLLACLYKNKMVSLSFESNELNTETWRDSRDVNVSHSLHNFSFSFPTLSK